MGTLAGGETVAPRTLALTATTNTKTYDATTNAAATPTITPGILLTGDTIANLTEAYSNANAGSSKTLTVASYTINDSNGGNNYSVTTVNDTTGLISQAPLIITATSYFKPSYDSTTSAPGATPTISGLQGHDTVTGFVEVFNNANAGPGKTLSVSSYTVNDGNGGNTP